MGVFIRKWVPKSGLILKKILIFVTLSRKQGKPKCMKNLKISIVKYSPLLRGWEVQPRNWRADWLQDQVVMKLVHFSAFSIPSFGSCCVWGWWDIDDQENVDPDIVDPDVMQEKVAYIFLPRSILCMPITIRGNVIGVVQMINKKSGEGMFTRVSRLIGVNR